MSENQDDFLRARRFFEEAVSLSPQDRLPFLERLSKDEPILSQWVQRWLNAHQDDGVLDGKASDHVPTLDPEGVGVVFGDSTLSRAVGRKVILGDYEFLQEIAHGGIGVVYRVRQLSLNRVVAIKVLRSGRLASRKEVERFRAEAEAAARLDHPNIVPIYEVGELEGRPFFSMKFIDGPSLASQVDRFVENPRSAASLLVKVTSAVHHAHQRGVLHRDLKPSNILLDAEGTPYVADFGIAKLVDRSGDATGTALIVGTPAYMAPEQTRPDGGGVTVKTDVYALGCILYQLLTGRPPFEGESISEIFSKVADQDPPPISSLNPLVDSDLETICLKCLAKQPWRRYQSASELGEDLERWLAGKPISARKIGTRERVILWAQRKPLVAGLTVVVLALIALLFIGGSVGLFVLQQNLDRALEAEGEAKQRLRNSLIAQARANRRSGEPGRRHHSLELLAQAAVIQGGPDLRDEAIAALSLTDLQVLREWPRSTGAEETFVQALPIPDHLAIGFENGIVQIRKGDTVLQELKGPGMNGVQPWIPRFDPNGRYMALRYHGVRGENAQFWVWDLASGQPVVVREGASLGFDLSEREVFLVDSTGELVGIDLASKREVSHLKLVGERLEIALSPDNQFLAVIDNQSLEVRVYQTKDLFLVTRFKMPAPGTALDFSPDGQLLAVASYDFNSYVWDWQAGRLISVLKGHQGEAVLISFHPQYPLVATYAWDETTRLWEPMTGEELLVSPFRMAGFSADGRQLAFTTSDKFGIWDVHHGDFVRTLYGHSGKSPIRLAINARGEWLASAGFDRVIVWDIETGQRLAEFTPGASDAIWDPRGGGLLTCTPGEGLVLRTLSSRAEEIQRETLLPECFRLGSDAAGRHLATGVNGRVIVIDRDNPEGAVEFEAHRGAEFIALSPAGDLAGSGNWRGENTRVYQTANGRPVADLLPGQTGVAVAFSPDGEWLISASPREFRAWSTSNWHDVWTIDRPAGFTNLPGHLAFSNENDLAAFGITKRLLALYDFRSGEQIGVLDTPGLDAISWIEFSPQGDRLAMANTTNRIHVWELDHLKEELERLNMNFSQGTSLWTSADRPSPVGH